MTYGSLNYAQKTVDRLTAERLERRALSSAVTAKARLVKLFGLISQLTPKEQEDVRLFMQVGLAAAAHREGVSKNQVAEWALTNIVESQMAIAWKTSEWSAAKIDPSQPKSKRQQLLEITRVAQKVWDAHRVTTDCVSELVSRGGTRGAALWARLNRE